ncbi:Phomenoic acid biosynthesis cluster MFS-type transporter [Penicillium diatomitis]|uniref:Phomenoic acid biosynthesis cluster MFS-type transporter n=1 Tax=Penicillium diatomitis TaxID=2819901 RepID=A0A9W9XM28_9EURO|nr:Phomenoic acid biosynthesis cluster MFS-type transporter [Penicillium diatomitis]KAJ5495496.1 Phomenoic acid biosynthesis cluster MFS-type transporter [Penicillium diatomitis]
MSVSNGIKGDRSHGCLIIIHQCVVLFMAGSALCGAAPDMKSMIVGRAMAGAGGSGMYFGVLT